MNISCSLLNYFIAVTGGKSIITSCSNRFHNIIHKYVALFGFSEALEIKNVNQEIYQDHWFCLHPSTCSIARSFLLNSFNSLSSFYFLLFIYLFIEVAVCFGFMLLCLFSCCDVSVVSAGVS